MFAAEMRQDPEGVIHLLLDQLAPYLESEPKLSSVQAAILLRKIYVSRYGLVSVAILEARPASLVAYRQAEDSFFGSLLDDHLDAFLDLEIYQVTGMKWTDYISLPRHEMERVKAVVERRRKRKNTSEANAVSQAEKAMQHLTGKG